ncbi:serine hydrolase [Microbulbifer sp. VAAF005]|uniref:serine hydrolase n=1 Tax=Microbulbifer sp. VAAF005 TaxID=3034230 RepID=UPI0024ADE735|nr:serine hydrolase [Microbulbifer sp. VAAF005]WHI48267.1 serine hydrolase [Microbulbifer sp. VAAF005]
MTPDPVVVPGEEPWCPYKMAKFREVSLDFEPGQRQSYSNLGYCLLGAVLAQTHERPYKEYLLQNYDLHSRGIKFIASGYYPDEVEYDFRNSPIYGKGYTSQFDFNALASSAGLTGSAVALASAVLPMLDQVPMNILSDTSSRTCDMETAIRCYGFGLYTYRSTAGGLKVFVQPGRLYGMSGTLLIDEYGGVTVRLGNGEPERLSTFGMDKVLYQKLSAYYGK